MFHSEQKDVIFAVCCDMSVGKTEKNARTERKTNRVVARFWSKHLKTTYNETSLLDKTKQEQTHNTFNSFWLKQAQLNLGLSDNRRNVKTFKIDTNQGAFYNKHAQRVGAKGSLKLAAPKNVDKSQKIARSKRKRSAKAKQMEHFNAKILLDTPEQVEQLRQMTGTVLQNFQSAVAANNMTANVAMSPNMFQMSASPVTSKALTNNNKQIAQSTVVGSLSGYWNAFSSNWAVGMVVNISATLAVTGIAASAAPALGVSIGLAVPLARIGSTLVGSLAVSVVRHSSTIVTDPKTGLKSVVHDFAGTLTGAVATEALSSTPIGWIGGQIVGRVAGNTVQAIFIGRTQAVPTPLQLSQQKRLSQPLQKSFSERMLVANQIFTNARKSLTTQKHTRAFQLAKNKSKLSQSDNVAHTKSKLSVLKTMRTSVLIAGATMALVAFCMPMSLLTSSAAFGFKFAGEYAWDFVTQLWQSSDVRAETWRAITNHPYLYPLLKQSVLRQLPMSRVDKAVDQIVRKLARSAGVKQLDNKVQRLLRGRVRAEILQHLLLEDILVQLAQETSRQSMLFVAEKSAQTVASNWDTIGEAVDDITSAATQTARSVRNQLNKWVKSNHSKSVTPQKAATVDQIVGSAAVAGAQKMAQSELQRTQMQSQKTQDALAKQELTALAVEQQKIQLELRKQQKLARRARNDRLNERIAQRAQQALEQRQKINEQRKLHSRALQKAAKRRQVREQAAQESLETLNAQREAIAKASNRVQKRTVEQENERVKTNTLRLEQLKSNLLGDRDIIMQQVWEENFSDSTLDLLQNVQAPSIARVAAEAYAGGALTGALGLQSNAAKLVGRAVPTVADTYQAGIQTLQTLTSTSRVALAKDIAKEGARGKSARLVRQLDEALETLPPVGPISRETLIEQLKESTGIHSTTVQGFDIDKATSWSARDSIIRVLGLEPGKEWTNQLAEVATDVGFGVGLRNAAQRVLTSFFSDEF